MSIKLFGWMSLGEYLCLTIAGGLAGAALVGMIAYWLPWR